MLLEAIREDFQGVFHVNSARGREKSKRVNLRSGWMMVRAKDTLSLIWHNGETIFDGEHVKVFDRVWKPGELGEYYCFTCEHRWTFAPGPGSCPKCGAIYVSWENWV